jgi:hypothetical protein
MKARVELVLIRQNMTATAEEIDTFYASLD